MKSNKKSSFERRFEIGILEAIIFFIIIIEILDFFRIIPPVLEFVEKTLAVITISYLFYKVSMSRILFGHRKKLFDSLIVLSYLFLGVKTIMGFVISASAEHSILSPFYSLIISHINIIEKTCFRLGILSLFIIAVVLVSERIGRPSFMYIIHEQRPASSVWKKVLHFLTIYLSLIAFFALVFTFAIEWLATTVDAPVMVLAILLFLSVIVKQGKRMKADSFLRKASESSEEFYETVIELFQLKSRISIAIIGFLVLHILVEVGHFILPYTTGLGTPWYFHQLGPGHHPLIVPLLKDFALASTPLLQFSVILVYLLNVLAVLMLFIAPAYLWFHLYKDRQITPGNLTWIFFGTITVFFLAPVFRIKPLDSGLLIGTDIITQQIPHIQNLAYVLLAGLLVASIFLALSHRFPKKTARVAFFTALVYFAFYLFCFFVDVWNFYVEAVIALLRNHQFVIGTHIFLFFVMTILFYVGGYCLLIYEVYAKQKL